MPTQRILELFVQLLVAIEHVHSLNILHRDLKTQNVLMNRKRTVLKIGDFGISKVLSSKITSAVTVSHYYMYDELLKLSDHKYNVYGLYITCMFLFYKGVEE